MTNKKRSKQIKFKSEINLFRLALKRLSIEDQKSLFNCMDPRMRLALWRDRLQSAAKKLDSKKQRRVLKDIRQELNTSLFSDNNEEQLKHFDTFWSAISENPYHTFKSNPGKLEQILTTLGSSKKAKQICLVAPTPECTCNTSLNGNLRENDCGGISRACESGNCTPTNWGCGYFWLRSCDGLCTGSDFPGEKKKGKQKTQGQ